MLTELMHELWSLQMKILAHYLRFQVMLPFALDSERSSSSAQWIILLLFWNLLQRRERKKEKKTQELCVCVCVGGGYKN